jgi:flagellar biosynthetic protein FlhB
MAEDKEQNTEQPTGKRLEEAMDKGQFARSPEIQVVFTLAAVLTTLGFVGRPAVERLAEFTISTFTRFPKMVVRPETVVTLFGEIVLTVAPVVLPLLFACSGAALLAGGLQSGFHVSPKALGIKFERLNPLEGFKRVFAVKDMMVRSAIDALKITTVGIVLYTGARRLLLDPLFSAPIEAAYLGQFLNQATMTFFSRMIFSLGVIAAIHYAYEKVKTRKDLMMSKQEVKDESKNTEVNSKIKGAQKRLARRLMQRQMLDAVATADVVVTNPTHYAVALKYERGRDRAPVVLAKGENRFAMRLKALAAEHGVPMVENVPVARLLYAAGRVGEAIPPQLYQAVAEILAVVYRTHRYYFHQLRARRLVEHVG